MIGERLKRARTDRGWTLEAVARLCGLSAPSLSEFETGKREPRLVHLETLAQAFGLPVGWFFGPETPASDVVLWRERPADAAAAEVEGRFLSLCRWYRNLEEWCDDPAPCTLPDVTGDPARFSWSDVENLAISVRRELDLGQQPAASLLSVLENTCGIRIFHLDFEPSGTAACTRGDAFGMGILLNAANVRWRRNFDLAHELFHLLTWRIFRSGETTRAATPEEEQFANAFASTLLIPEESLRRAVNAARKSDGGLRHAEIFDLARQFDVSADAMLWRMHRVFNRREEHTRRDLAVCRALRDAAEIREDTRPPALPERYRALAIRALRDGELSIGRAAQYLGITRQQAMALDDSGDVEDDAITLDPS